MTMRSLLIILAVIAVLVYVFSPSSHPAQRVPLGCDASQGYLDCSNVP